MDERSELYQYLYRLCGFAPNDIRLYKQALTHRSLGGESNERLEYLGDALLGFVIADELYHIYPDETEGFLTQARSHAVCRRNLNNIARELSIDKHLRVIAKHKNNTENIYGNALEALVGAIYLDKGYEAAVEFINRVIVGKKAKRLLKLSEHETDFKSRLLEYAQSRHLQVEFVLSSERYEPQIDRHVFTFVVLIDGAEVANASGYNKREAQQAVAKKVLKNFGYNNL